MNKQDEEIAKALKVRPYILAVDVDGCLAEKIEWQGFEVIGKPIPSVVEYVREAKARGCYITINTCRVTTLHNKISPESLDALRKWLKDNDVPYDEIWAAAGKPYANEYVDDRALNPFCSECQKKKFTFTT